MSNISITELVLTPTSAAERAEGLEYFLRFTIDDRVVVNGVTLRRTAAGHLRLSWPAKRDRFGIERHFVEPVAVKRAEIDKAVMRAVDRALSGGGR